MISTIKRLLGGKLTVYTNIYCIEGKVFMGPIWYSREEALGAAESNRYYVRTVELRETESFSLCPDVYLRKTDEGSLIQYTNR